MFPNFIRLILAAGCVVWAGFQFVDSYILNGISILLLGGIFVLTFFKNETLIWALLQMRRNKMDKAAKTLARIKNPESALVKRQQAYFFYLQGMIQSQSNINQGEKLLKKALNMGLKSRYDVAIAKLNLAGVAMSRRRKREATNLLSEVKKLDNRGLLKDQIIMMKQQMKKI